MVRNYLTIAWRNLLKHKFFSIINILGLAIGIAACLMISLYVHNEISYDLYNLKADRIVRVTATIHTPESDLVLATSPIPLADFLKKDYPEVESAVRFEPAPVTVKFNNDVFSEASFYKTDQTVFSIFSFDFIEGSPAGALLNPNSIVLTEAIAKKYFGNQPALGKTMICNELPILVTGVIRNRPANSDMQIDALLSAVYPPGSGWMDDFDHYTYILFKKIPDLKAFKQKLALLSAKYIQPDLDKEGANKYKVGFELEPLAAVHFDSGKLADTPKGNRQFNYIFSLLAVFILVIALLNYINLSTAKSAERAKEVGIRKVSGALQSQLMMQFLFESFLIVSISCALAFGIVQICLPFFNQLLETKLAINWVYTFLFIFVLFIITLLLAGLYPAFVLSAFKPVEVLKGKWRYSHKGVFLRKVVTVTQFAIAAALIMGTTVIYTQMKFIRQKDLGFNKDQLLNILLPRDSAYISAVHGFQNALRQRPEVRGLTIGSGMTQSTMSSTVVRADGKSRELMCVYFSIDPQFLPVFDIRLTEGRNLSESFGTDKQEAFLVNEAFVKTMGWKSGIGKSVEGFDHKGKIVGVVKNFYYQSLHNLVDPLVMVYNKTPSNTTSVKISPVHLSMVKDLYKKFLPSVPIDYSFFDELIDKQYKSDQITMSLFNDFTVLAIFVSCLGLYGLVALIAAQRNKEIGIRKVLGASLRQLLLLLSKDFIKLICWALLIALPVAGFAMHKWLGVYAYHVQLSWWMFLVPVFLVLFIALAVISREMFKAALINPVNSLRSE